MVVLQIAPIGALFMLSAAICWAFGTVLFKKHKWTSPIIALAYLFVMPMVLCQWAYFKVVHIFPAAIAAIGTLGVPVVGVFPAPCLAYYCFPLWKNIPPPKSDLAPHLGAG